MKIEGEIPSQADVDAILALVDAVQDAQSREDVDAFVGLFRKDALWVTGHGKRLYGLDTIAEFTARVLPGATKDSYAAYVPDHLLFVRPDIAVVNVNQTYVRRDESAVEPPVEHGSPVYLLAKDDKEVPRSARPLRGWQIAAAQNTVVVAT
ncbi:SgcJ/EcaC family oxidoreductase [Kribbella turkmenica]|uniref:SgcJ/EcaC family oxidoreductase n=1 Tax=Kribbella turkmenica TaxID=2530375 RepID=A0A4V2YF31_9ACTN|nr:SgcJ/EcaC family oxidoreductase [Kribbella turkmenica]TDD21547.1 SgcJ/EcaC family oxidoreductase [Kribbella turkmenica]